MQLIKSLILGLLLLAGSSEAGATVRGLRAVLESPTAREIFWIVAETPEGGNYFRYSGDAIRFRFRPDLAASEDLSHILGQLNRIDFAVAEAAPELTRVTRNLTKLQRELQARGLITRHGRLKEGSLRYIDREVRTMFTLTPQEREFVTLMDRAAEQGVVSYYEARDLFLDAI